MNIGNPSPQEIFDSYSQIPNTPQGKQQLAQLVQAFKNSGDMRGSIATSILNSYNSQQPPAPPPPQGQVADQVVAQAEPASWMQGIAAPGLSAPGMATGGLVAFAEGGPVRGFLGGGYTGEDYNPFMDAMPEELEAPDTTPYMMDLLQSPQRQEQTAPASNDSFEARINKLQEIYGTPPDIAAELLSRMEYEQAQRNKFNAFENIAAGLGGYLSAYGPGQHRAGVGIASMLASMGQHTREEREDESAMNALRMKSAAQPYEMRKSLVDQVMAAEAAHKKAAQEAALQLKLAKMQQETAYGKERIGGEYGLKREGMQGQTSRDVAEINKQAKIDAAIREGLSGGNRTSLYNSIMKLVENEVIKPEEVDTYYKEALRRVGTTDGSASQPSSTAGQPVQLTAPKGNTFTGWLSNR